MKCDKCNRDIPIDSEFCPICGNKLQEMKEEKKTIKISFKTIIIGILIILIFIAIISFMIFNKKKNNLVNKDISNNENQNIKINNKESENIPDNEKVTVAFIEGINDRKYEDRRIYNRTSLLDYVSNNDSKVREDILNKNLGVVYESAGGIFYFECDTKLGSKTTDYGSIIFFNYMKSTHSGFYFTTIATIWSTTTLNNYTVAYTQKMVKDVKPEVATEIRNNKMITVINDYYNKLLNGFDISNVRIGLIESNMNGYWMEEYAEEQAKNQIPEGEDSKYATYADNIYEAYKKVLDMANKEAEEKNSQESSEMEIMDVQYGLVDINNDKIKELVILIGTCNADYQYIFYTFEGNKATRIGKVEASTSTLYKMNNENYLKQVIMNMRSRKSN